MRKFLLTTAAVAATLSLSAITPASVCKLTNADNSSEHVQRIERNLDIRKNSDRQQRVKARRHAAPIMKAVPGPGADDKVIDEAPEGTVKTMEKFGMSYGYSMFTGLVQQNCDGSIQEMVTTTAGDIYLKNPIFFYYNAEENYIKGKLEGDIVTFTFPQLISVYTYYDDDGNIDEQYLDYMLKLEFVAEEEGSDTGWYYPCEDQTYKMRLLPDGTLQPLDSELDYMLGQCEWFEADEDSPAGWSWQGNGDFYSKLVPFDKVAVTIPEGLTSEKWDLITGISARKVNVAFDEPNKKVYITSLFNKTGVKNNAVVGTLDGNKITLADNQFLGIYDNQTVYFQTWLKGAEGYDATEAITLNYDAEKKIMQAAPAEAISFTSADGRTYWTLIDEPYIAYPNPDAVITKLQNPVISKFWDYDPEYGDPNEIMFNFPIVDADKNVITDTSKLFFQVFMDGELYTFYNDEYVLPEGVEEMTDVPYDYTSEKNKDGYCDFKGGKVSHDFLFYPVGFDTFGIRTLYKDGDKVLYSDIVYAEGYGPNDGVEGIESGAEIVKTEIFDLNGNRVANPENGIYIVRKTAADGKVSVKKAVVRK